MNDKKNYFSALLLQIFTMISGLILPRLMISTLGSEVNGLCSSINQFLSFITLLEGGLGAVVLAELYIPIANQDDYGIKRILCACQNFFEKLSLVFLAYTLIISIIYPIFWAKSFSFTYTATLIWILSISTLVQYMFAITNKLLLQAFQKIYIVNYISTFATVINLILAVIVIYIYPEVHLIKLVSACIYLIQPFLYRRYIDKKYLLNKSDKSKERNTALKNRWSGFAQNLAYFINMNTDVAVLTIFMSLSDVSVYSIYMLAVVALRAIIISLSNSYQGALGKYYAEGNIVELKSKFEKFEKQFWIISMVLFFTCLLLINFFVKLYTSGVNDANYSQPLFACIMVVANLLYCIREPYRLLVLATGRFKETNFGAIMEAFLNFVISVVLVNRMGLVGVAIGTFIAILYRFLYFIWYLKKDIIFKKYKEYTALFTTLLILLLINMRVYYTNIINIDSFIEFIIFGCITLVLEVIITIGIGYISDKLCNFIIRRGKK